MPVSGRRIHVHGPDKQVCKLLLRGDVKLGTLMAAIARTLAIDPLCHRIMHGVHELVTPDSLRTLPWKEGVPMPLLLIRRHANEVALHAANCRPALHTMSRCWLCFRSQKYEAMKTMDRIGVPPKALLVLLDRFSRTSIPLICVHCMYLTDRAVQRAEEAAYSEHGLRLLQCAEAFINREYNGTPIDGEGRDLSEFFQTPWSQYNQLLGFVRTFDRFSDTISKTGMQCTPHSFATVHLSKVVGMQALPCNAPAVGNRGTENQPRPPLLPLENYHKILAAMPN